MCTSAGWSRWRLSIDVSVCSRSGPVRSPSLPSNTIPFPEFHRSTTCRPSVTVGATKGQVANFTFSWKL